MFNFGIKRGVDLGDHFVVYYGKSRFQVFSRGAYQIWWRSPIYG